MEAPVYDPKEDSFLLSKALKQEIPKIKNYSEKKFLEIGSGGGIQLETLNNLGINKKNIHSCDINPSAIEICRKKGFNSVKSDLFENIREKYDVILFNPPYLPDSVEEPENSKINTTGGKEGSEIINKFLRQSKKHLNKKGIIFLLTSSLTKNIKWDKFKIKKIAERKIFFETLYVWRLYL